MGAIIQEVHYSGHYNDCPAGAPPICPAKISGGVIAPGSYIEAWNMLHGVEDSNNNNNGYQNLRDTFGFTPSSVSCTCGDWTEDGYSAYYYGCQAGNPWGPGRDCMSLILYSMPVPTDPHWVRGDLHKHLDLAWNCCHSCQGLTMNWSLIGERHPPLNPVTYCKDCIKEQKSSGIYNCGGTEPKQC